MIGKFLASFIVICGALAGGSMYYLQVFAFYDEVVPNGFSDVVLTKRLDNNTEPIPYSAFQAINSRNSGSIDPIRTTGHSTSPDTSANSDRSLTNSCPQAKA